MSNARIEQELSRGKITQTLHQRLAPTQNSPATHPHLKLVERCRECCENSKHIASSKQTCTEDTTQDKQVQTVLSSFSLPAPLRSDSFSPTTTSNPTLLNGDFAKSFLIEKDSLASYFAHLQTEQPSIFRSLSPDDIE
ncbi:hypothetical protein BLNAU_12772 [Blattamonas nauphoetae]|uniref:Uncharacterized protein n=1 Tax=Blattamonas nauphoetae TaxID=2049346 RepID=A0ABQ9XIF7_9EUKA|nr:hypothetical protein BLNAU_12772 [Blattamonas nauphoetae]